MTHIAAEAIILLWTELTGGPAIRVNSRPKQPNSGLWPLDSVVSGALAFTVVAFLTLPPVTGRTELPKDLHAQLNVSRTSRCLLRAHLGICLPGTPKLPNTMTPSLSYLLHGCPLVHSLPNLLLLTI